MNITKEMLTDEQWAKKDDYVKLYHALHKAIGIEPFVEKTAFKDLTLAEFSIIMDAIDEVIQ